MLKKFCLALLAGLFATSVSAQVVVGGGGGSGSGGGTWGSIAGTLSDQTDLNTALGGKLPEPASSGYVVRTGAGASAARTFASLTGTITVTNADGTAGNTSFDVATSVIPSYATGTSLPATCTPFAQMFGRTDTHLGYLCTNNNFWMMLNDATALQGTVPVASGGTNLTTAADDNVMVGNATTWETKAVPDCDDSGGNHLNYDTGTNAFSCGTSGGSSGLDLTKFTLLEDFATGTTTSAQLGSNGFSITLISSGTTAMNTTSPANNPGIVRLSSHTSNDNSGATISLSQNSTNLGTMWDGEEWTIKAIVNLGSNSTAITNTAFWFGLTNSFATSGDGASKGIWIRRDTDLSDSSFMAQICDNSGANGCNSAAASTDTEVTALSTTPSAGTFYLLTISQDFTGPGSSRKITMQVNAATAVTFCSSGCTTTIAQAPSGTALTPYVAYVTRTTTGVLSADLDLVYVSVSGLSRY